MTPIVQMRPLRLREGKPLPKGHTVSKWSSGLEWSYPASPSVLVSEGLSGEPHGSRHWHQKVGGEGSLHLRGEKGGRHFQSWGDFPGGGSGLPGGREGQTILILQIPQPPPPRALCAQQCARSTQSLQISTSPGTHGACQERSRALQLTAPAPTCLPIPQTLPAQAGGRPHALCQQGEREAEPQAGGCVPSGGRQTVTPVGKQLSGDSASRHLTPPLGSHPALQAADSVPGV